MKIEIRWNKQQGETIVLTPESPEEIADLHRVSREVFAEGVKRWDGPTAGSLMVALRGQR